MNNKLGWLRAKAVKLPLSPGVYIMRERSGNIIYIGKAKQLKNRVSQYFGSQNRHAVKVAKMVEHVDDFDYILTDSEFEALVLECSLIKQYQPKYNILLKDDKGYSYIRVTKEQWPKISAVKQTADDGARYIGPYTSSFTVTQAVDEALKIFHLPQCNKVFPRDCGKSRPCLNFFIGQCCAPCGGKIKREEYRILVEEALDFLKGGSAAALKTLEEKMQEAAENLDFEKAARFRDRIRAIQKTKEKQKVVASKIEEQDVFALARDDTGACFEVFRYANGSLFDREHFLLDGAPEDAEARSELLSRYYSMRDRIPPRITLDGETQDEVLLSEWLSEKAGHKVTITVPQKGDQLRLVEMCKANAAERLAQKAGRGTGRDASVLAGLAKLLGLDKPPEYIESYDISHTAGRDNVAGMVVFQNARPYKAAYRRFIIKGFDGQDDYGSMREVLTRRLREYEKEKESGKGFGRLPDLILLDGGQGQVSAVLPVLEEFGISVPVFGMVKDNKHRTRAIAKDGGEIEINSNRQVFTLVSSIQEEVHRFSIAYHHARHKSRSFSTDLLNVEGIGKTRAKELLRHFKTLTGLKEASVEQLCEVKGMNHPAAEAVYRFYHPQNEKYSDESKNNG